MITVHPYRSAVSTKLFYFRFCSVRLAFSLVGGLLLCAFGSSIQAQEARKVPKIGFLAGSSKNELIPFRERLRELNYVEGQSMTIEPRYWSGKVERLPGIIAEFVRLNCDVIVTTGTEAAQAAKKGSQTIPCYAIQRRCRQAGNYRSLARPGANVTGLTSINAELSGKRVEILKEIVPGLSRLALIWSPGNPNTEHVLKETAAAARLLRVVTHPVEVKSPEEFEQAFQSATKNGAGAFMLGGGGFLSAHQKTLVEQATKSRLPGVYPNLRYVEAGGLMTYTEDPSTCTVGRRVRR